MVEDKNKTIKILLVDDEPRVRQVGTQMLTILGFKVLTAAQGARSSRYWLAQATPSSARIGRSTQYRCTATTWIVAAMKRTTHSGTCSACQSASTRS